MYLYTTYGQGLLGNLALASQLGRVAVFPFKPRATTEQTSRGPSSPAKRLLFILKLVAEPNTTTHWTDSIDPSVPYHPNLSLISLCQINQNGIFLPTHTTPPGYT